MFSNNTITEKNDNIIPLKKVKVKKFITGLMSQNRTAPEMNPDNRYFNYSDLLESVNLTYNNYEIREKINSHEMALQKVNFLISEKNRIGLALNGQSGLKRLQDSLLTEIAESFSCARGLLLKFTDEPFTAEIASLYNVTHLDAGQKIKITPEREQLRNLIKTGNIQTVRNSNILNIYSNFNLCIPIKSNRGMLGILCLFDRSDESGVIPFSDNDIETVVSLVNHASSIWQKIKIYEMASLDSLTGLFTRKLLMPRFTEEIKRSRITRKELSVLLIDIDHFKKVNDTWGHQAGDSVLKEVAAKIRESIRRQDIAIRYGGEEIMVIAPETNKKEAGEMAERIREIIQNTEIELPFSPFPLQATVSIGLATFPSQGETIEKLVEKADIALYRSKASGRNRVTVFCEGQA